VQQTGCRLTRQPVLHVSQLKKHTLSGCERKAKLWLVLVYGLVLLSLCGLGVLDLPALALVAIVQLVWSAASS